MAESLVLACVGAGYWGRNLVRIFHNLAEARLKVVCDANQQIRTQIGQQYREVEVQGDYRQVLADREVEAVVLAVPAARHFAMARQALEAGKHVYVEKPLTLDAGEALALVSLAEEQGKVLMVGHLMEYHPAVRLVKGLIQQGELGEIYYLYSQRVNLGIVRRDENALWSLAPHDISVALYLLEMQPSYVSAQGESYLQPGIPDVVFVNMHFPDKKMAQLQVSWLDPHRVRKLTIVGSKKMVVFDDVESTEKVRIYDKAAERSQYDSYGEAITLRFGDVVMPHLRMAEPLKLECQHFVECVREGRVPLSDGRDGLRVVRILEAAQRSLEKRGSPVEIKP